jgi:hypothetical protein
MSLSPPPLKHSPALRTKAENRGVPTLPNSKLLKYYHHSKKGENYTFHLSGSKDNSEEIWHVENIRIHKTQANLYLVLMLAY